ncbi:Conserved_hypothetical protein [Hexamita inflata]|uniref:Uncharacterized protein n=1 Tax=Hexamita inflata TaxID=28002 RepID=A0AA86UJR8_9EUKA|nr:Conserved hypothetical protein [Hexamita inflata]
MNSDFKPRFGKAFLEMIQLKTRVACKDVLEAHREFLRRQDGVKFDLWKDMSLALGTSPKKIHDFYHNTWSKQFYDAIDPFREQIKALVRGASGRDSTQEVTRQVIARLRRTHADVNLHYQTVYQYVNYQVKNNAMANASKSRDSVSGSREDNKAKVEQDQGQTYESLFPMFDFNEM